MTRLLTPGDVSKGKAAAEREANGRVRDLAIEESRLVASINTLRNEEAEELRKKAEREAERERGFADRKGPLQIEVETLEERKRVALEPIAEIRNQAQTILSENEHEKLVLADRAKALKAGEDKLAEEIAQWHDRKQELDEYAVRLDDRQKGIDSQAADTKRSGETLQQKWVEYYDAAEEFNKRVEAVTARENAAAAAETANKVRAEQLDKREADYQMKDREIADRYATLESASKEILGK